MRRTTDALADRLGVKPASIRAAVCRTGSYYGVKPVKLPNGRLLWPEGADDRIVNAGRPAGKEGDK